MLAADGSEWCAFHRSYPAYRLKAAFDKVRGTGDPCGTCEGSGKCDECKGEGEVDCECDCGDVHTHECDDCGGSGQCQFCEPLSNTRRSA